MTIKSIEIRNLRSIEHFKAELGQFNVVLGENGAGKTTLLDALRFFFDGGSNPDMIRRMDLDGDGVFEKVCEYGQVILTLSDDTVFEKRQTSEGYTLTGKTPMGGKVPSPATYLKDLASGMSFDPLKFLEAPLKKQGEYLLDNLPVQFTAEEVCAIVPAVTQKPIGIGKLNELRAGQYEERSEYNRAAKEATALYNNLRKALPPESPVKWKKEVERLSEAFGAVRDQGQSIHEQADAAYKEKAAELTMEAERKIAAIRQALSAELAGAKQRAEEWRAEQLKDIAAEQTRLAAELATARANAEAEAKAKYVKEEMDKAGEAMRKANAQSDLLTRRIESLDDLKHRKLKELPIDGLDVRLEDGKPVITLNKIPIDQLNRQRQIFFAIQATRLASKGTMPLVICESSELDTAHLSDLAEAAKEAGLQMVVARWADNAPLRLEKM